VDTRLLRDVGDAFAPVYTQLLRAVHATTPSSLISSGNGALPQM
jgi:hypothetical protein